MDDAVLRVEGLCRRFGQARVVDGLDFELRRGETLGFLGPNGAGKTTTIRMICGLLHPDAGRVLLHDQPLAPGDTQARRRIGVCPQENVLWPRMTCLEQLRFMGRLYGGAARQVEARAEALLEELGLVDKRGALAGTFSGGMQRRLNLALALVHDPEVLILDEPEAGLDPQSRVRVREFIRRLAGSRSILLTTHNMDEADRLSDRVAIMDRGRLLLAGTPEEVKRSAGAGDILSVGLAGGAEPSPEAVAAVAQYGGSWVPEERCFALRAPGAASLLPCILEDLRVCSARPGEVRIRENTLEDAFIALTGRSLRA